MSATAYVPARRIGWLELDALRVRNRENAVRDREFGVAQRVEGERIQAALAGERPAWEPTTDGDAALTVNAPLDIDGRKCTATIEVFVRFVGILNEPHYLARYYVRGRGYVEQSVTLMTTLHPMEALVRWLDNLVEWMAMVERYCDARQAQAVRG